MPDRRMKGAFSSATYERTAREVHEVGGGTSTYKGETRHRQGLGIDPLVDPSSHGAIRESRDLLVPQDDGTLLLIAGIGMPVRTGLDTTGSMGHNVDIAFGVLPRVQNLLVQGQGAVLRRYHVQIATAIIQDVGDSYAHLHSEFEPDNEVERQMGLLVPERGGGDAIEDYQLHLWYAAHRTQTDIVAKHGLRGYDFIVGDEMGREEITPSTVRSVYKIDGLQSAIPTRDVGRQLLKTSHAFYLQVGEHQRVTSWWMPVLGRDRLVHLPRTEDIAEVQAVIIGLTEGVLDLQSAVDFLTEARVPRTHAQKIVRAVSHIPLRAQADLPNFNRIPEKGTIFASREDTRPVNDERPVEVATPRRPSGEITWSL